MTSTDNTDPFETWRQFVTKLENDINSMANSSMNSEEFSRMLHQFSQSSVGIQHAVGKALDGYFKALRLPNQADIKNIEESLQRLEEKIDRLLSTEGRESAQDLPLRTRQQSSSPKATAEFPNTSPDRGRKP